MKLKAVSFFSLLFFLLCPFFLHAKVVDRIVAIVNNDVITQYDLDRAMAYKIGQLSRSVNPEMSAQTSRERVLNELIDQKLLEQEMIKANIEVNDEDLARAIANVLQKNGINIEILRAELAAKGVSFEAYKEQLRQQIKQAKFMQQSVGSQVQVSDLDVENSKTKRVDPLLQNATAHLAWIYFSLDSDATAKDIKSVVRKARKITDRIRKGEDFAKLAKEYSKGPEAGQGGDLGTKLLKDLPGPVAAEVRIMKEGSVSDPLVTPQGVYIVKLFEKSVKAEETKTAQDDLQLRQNIYNERMDQEINNFVLKLRQKAYIDIRE